MATRNRKYTLYFIATLAAVLLANAALQRLFFRIDLTSDKRYTLAEVSKETMRGLNETVFLRVYLEGEMPIGLKQLRQSVAELLDELSVHADGKLQYQLINPSEGSEQKRNDLYQSLYTKGLMPIIAEESDREGGESQRMVFPGAIAVYNGKEKAINFIHSNPAFSPDQNVSNAIQNLEFELVSNISLLTRSDKARIAFVEGNGELDEYEVGDISRELADYYAIDRVILGGEVGGLNDYAAVIIAKPRRAWSEADKLVIDQYIMKGGSVVWFIDAIHVEEDSLAKGETVLAAITNHGLDDQLFRYGVRVNPNAVLDLNSAYIPVNVAPNNQPPDFKPSPWFHYPLLMPPTTHPITKNLNMVKAQYPSTIDTVGAKQGLRKTLLLTSSQYAKVVRAPFLVSYSQTAEKPVESEFNQAYLTIAVLVEGNFPSAFTNRNISGYNNGAPFDFAEQGQPAKMVVVADGDIIRNDVSRRPTGNRISPLGYDKYMNQTFGNRELVKNMLLYLTNDYDLINIRKKDFSLRFLDKQRVTEHRTGILTLNVGLPLLLVALFAIVFIWWRKRRYTR